ncbi:S1 family peptidase [Corynebacterium bovis]|uniref:trypsin-like serine protease n=1 Tax=Corynebacterium bovis TaxID=36808 RepID=UPI00313A04F1
MTVITRRPSGPTARTTPRHRMSRIITAATAVALASVATGGAATATAATPVAGGTQITMVKDGIHIGRCTATVVDKRTMYTAGHCGSVGATAEIGGKPIGTATRSSLRQGYDLLEIKLRLVTPSTPTPADLEYKPKVGDAVSKDGSISGHSEGTVRDPELRPGSTHESVHYPFDGEKFPVSTWDADLHSVRGDSGSPVIHDGKVVGIVKGGADDDDTTVTPLGEAVAALKP